MTVALDRSPPPLREALREACHREPATTEDLARAADRLRALPPSPGPDAPVAYLRNITPGPGRDPHEPLNGLPCFAGTTRMPDGSPVSRPVPRRPGHRRASRPGRPVGGVARRLIDAAEEAREELYALISGRRDVARTRQVLHEHPDPDHPAPVGELPAERHPARVRQQASPGLPPRKTLVILEWFCGPPPSRPCSNTTCSART